MTRLLTCGYETGDVNEAGTSTIGTNGVLAAVSSTPTPRSGSYCLKISRSTAGVSSSTKTFILAASKTELWVRFGVFCHPAGMGSSEIVIVTSQTSTPADQACLTWDSVTNILRARRAGSTGGAILGVSTMPLGPEQWHVLEWRQQFTSTSVGITEVWLNGTRVINFSGDNTQTTANVQRIILGPTSAAFEAATYFAFDDIAINDTAGTVNNGRVGDGQVLLLKPDGAGSSTQWVRGGTDTGANYTQVNELPPSLVQYVGSPTAGNRDLYGVEDLTGTPSIRVVEVLALAQNSDAGGGSLAPTVKSGSATSEAATVALSTTAAYATGRWETDPNTSAAWTSAAVNALEAGATVR